MVSLVKDIGRHRSERLAEASPVVWITVDGCVLRKESLGGGASLQAHIGGCRVEW